jgi:hypothetical protein
VPRLAPKPCLPSPLTPPAGKRKAAEDVLNAWSTNISKLLGLVDKATQQIQKEAMVHKVALGASA